MALHNIDEKSYSTATKSSFMGDMIHDLKKSLRGSPHSLSEIKESLLELKRKQVNFIELLELHHNYLKESIVVLLDKDAIDSEKQNHLERFLLLLEMHSKAEEETLYNALVTNYEKEARLEGLLGEDEHEIAYQLADELRDMHFSSLWSEDVDAKAVALATLVAQHLKEEERHKFSVAKDDIPREEMLALAPAYIDLCENYLSLSELKAKGLFL